MITTRFFSLILLLITYAATAQNLVPNHSFEEFVNGCPAENNEMPVSWTSWKESPNSFNTCVDPQNFSDSLGWAPWNGFGYQWPADGESYVGGYMHGSVNQEWSQNFREYLGCELIEPLEVGETYYVSFKMSMGFGNYYYPVWACNRLGAYFDTQGYHYQDNPLEIPNFAHVYEESIISDTVNWVTVEGSFVADQPYSHMGLGVFFEFNLLDTMSLVSVSSLGAYYFIDDVCVSRFPDCLTNTGFDHRDISAFSIYPNPANDQVTITGFEGLFEIRLLSIDGEAMHHFDVSGKNSIELPISDLSAGTYIIEIQSTTGYKRKKLVVLR